MKAPDKIYVHVRTDEEYIRKDTLLDWVKEKESLALTRIGKLTYKTIIEKIESM